MMKKLRLIRHAKSSWADPSLSDKQRPLKKRGRRDARLIAGSLEAPQWAKTRVYCSAAVRSRETLQLVMDELGERPKKLEYCERLYTFDAEVLVDCLRQLKDNDVTLVGHNPALHELVEWLTGDLLDRFPTCACCELDIDIADWSSLGRGDGQVRRYITPRMLKPAG